MRKVILCLILLPLIAPACASSQTIPPPTKLAPQTVPDQLSRTTTADSKITPPTATPTKFPTPSVAVHLGQSATPVASPTPTSSLPAQALVSDGPLVIEGLPAIHLIGDPQLGDSFYALTPAGLYITRDGGLTWAQVTSTPLQDQFVYSPAEPGVLYAGAGADCYRGGPEQPLYKSINGGATWSELPNGVNLHPVAVHPSDPDRIWAVGCTGPAYSSDGGDTWGTRDADLFLVYDVRQIIPSASDWSVIYISGVSEGGSGVIASSRDGGESWSPLLQESPEYPLWWINDLVVLPPLAQGDRHQLLLVDPHGAWRSQDGGNTWDFSDVGLEEVIYRDDGDFATSGLNTLAVDNNTIPTIAYLGTAQGVYQSLDGGETWVKLNHDTWSDTPILDLALAPALSGDDLASPAHRLLITTDIGVYVFTP